MENRTRTKNGRRADRKAQRRGTSQGRRQSSSVQSTVRCGCIRTDGWMRWLDGSYLKEGTTTRKQRQPRHDNETNPNTFYRAINPCKQSTNVHRIHNWAATLMSRPQQDEFLPFRAREKWMETGCAARPFFQQPRYSGMGEQLPSLPSALPLVGSLSRQACGSCAPLVL